MTAMTGAAMVVLSCTATGRVMDLGMEAGATPYERYMDPVKDVLRMTSNRDSELGRVSELLATARGFRYRHNEAYVARSPEVTERTRTGDCKDKSLWLLSKMGSGNARFVIGKLNSSSQVNHAWVYWQNEDGEWYILDPTHRSRPLPVESVKANEYVPIYSYASGSVYVHDASRPVQASRRPVAVAQSSKSVADEKVAKVEKAEKVEKVDTRKNVAAMEKSAKYAKVSQKEVGKAEAKVANTGAAGALPVAEKEETDQESTRAFAARLNRLGGGRSLL